jgi:L-rhamnose isomerase
VADKLSALLLFARDLFFHISRGLRWDSDHVVTLSDDVRAVATEIVRADAWKRLNIGLDYFDASINRIAAWVIGARATLKAILLALLEPTELLQREEASGNYTARLALMEELKDLPFGAVWDRYCVSQGVPVGAAWMRVVTEYEKTVLAGRK